MLHHIVLLKSMQMNKVDNVLESFSSLTGTTPGLINVEVHSDMSGKCNGYERLFIMDFDRKEDLAAWLEDERHVAIRKVFTEVAEMIVFDYEICK